jgi:hypothetical protein
VKVTLKNYLENISGSINMTSGGKSTPILTTLGNTVVLHYTSSTNDSDSESMEMHHGKQKKKEPSRTKKH